MEDSKKVVFLHREKFTVENGNAASVFIENEEGGHSVSTHPANLDPDTKKVWFMSLNLPGVIETKKLEKKFIKFFDELLKSKDWPIAHKMIVKITCDHRLTSGGIIELLNRYGVCGINGMINIHQEWIFSCPGRDEDPDLDKIMHGDSQQIEYYLHDIGAKGRRLYYESTKSIKIIYCLGKVKSY